VLRLLEYLQEAMYFDGLTLSVQGRLVVFNSPGQSFASVKLVISRALAGAFQLDVDVTAVPASAQLWAQGGTSAATEMLLIAMSACHIFYSLTMCLRGRNSGSSQVRCKHAEVY
jgi:hypothetical protein